MQINFSSPHERRVLADGRVVVEVVRLGEIPVLRVAHAPGWRWSLHSGTASGTERCSNVHVGVMTSGRMMIELSDGTCYDAGPGDVLAISAGHDAWTIGEQPAVLVQFDEGESARLRYRL